MISIKILGTGCPKCKRTFDMISSIAKEQGYTGKIEKIENINTIISYGIMSTPAVVIDEKIVFMGGVPSKFEIEKWFKNL